MTAPFGELLGVREPTMSLALSLLEERGGTRIVETGCTRHPDEWGGDGMSTMVFGRWCAENDGHLTTVDVDPNNIVMCKAVTRGYRQWITYVHDDSVAFLGNYDNPIDLLYLDSFDYPLMDIVTLYGTDFDTVMAHLRELGDDYIVAEHGDIIEDCQRHCLREIQAAPLHDRTVVVIDDANLPGGGKARMARGWLGMYGWHCVGDAYQTVWVR